MSLKKIVSNKPGLFHAAVLVSLLACNLEAQIHLLKSTRLSVDDGLSENSVNCILQDSEGFMWFGTRGGLNRYNGYDTKKFVHDARNDNSLSSNYITAILQQSRAHNDNASRTILWIGTDNGGLNRFDPHTGTATRFQAD